MRTEYDAEPRDTDDYKPPEKTRRQKRIDRARRAGDEKCVFCRHPARDHASLAGAERAIKWCHACTNKCPHDKEDDNESGSAARVGGRSPVGAVRARPKPPARRDK